MREKISFVVYKIKDGVPLFFVGKRPKNIWLHPTAKVEDGESYLECAFREIKEELGEVIILNFTDLKKSFQFNNEFGDFNEHLVAFEIKDVEKIQEEEFTEFQMLSAEEAIKILEHDNHKENIHMVEKMLKDQNENKFFIFVAPTACGKSVIIKSLLENFPEKFERVKTYMTRPYKRAEDSLLRIHVTKEEFEKLDEKGLLIEKNLHDGNWYGSSFKLIEEALKSSKNLIAEIDINGLNQLKKHFHNITSIFINAPLDQIEMRLRERGGHDEEEVERRMRIAKKEITRKNECDNVILNMQGELDKTIDKIKEIISEKIKEELI